MSENHRKEYLSRIHKAQDYIEANLAGNPKLEDVARAACFSPFHFHRVFSAVTGETLHQFISRLRLERAAGWLYLPGNRSITDIALDSGFSSSATFARAFAQAYGMSASEFRKKCKTLGKDGKAANGVDDYGGGMAITPLSRRPEMKNITPKQPLSMEVRDLPAKHLAYVRHVGPYAGQPDLFERLWGQLCQWAGPRGLLHLSGSENICVYHDDPDITARENLRISLGITVDAKTTTTPPVNLLEIPAGKYAVATYKLIPAEYGAAWQFVMGEWLPSSGYQPDDRPCYECFLNDPGQDPEGKHHVELRVAVKPL